MPKKITVQDVGIYEPIYLNGQTISQENFIPLLHTSNKHFANWREFRIHVEMFRNRVFEKHIFTGLFSPKFELKTKITGIEFAEFCVDNADADVVFINPFPQLAYMSFNIWMQAEANHSGIIGIAKNLLNDAGINLSINTKQRHCHKVLSYSSFWCGNAKFWNNYVGTILLPLADFIEKNPNAPSVRAALNDTFHTDPSPYLPFITERLFTTYVSQQHDLIPKYYPLNPTDYCLNQNEIDFIANTKPILDEADKQRIYPDSIKENLQSACNKSTIEAKEYYKKNVHPHTGRVIK